MTTVTVKIARHDLDIGRGDYLARELLLDNRRLLLFVVMMMIMMMVIVMVVCFGKLVVAAAASFLRMMIRLVQEREVFLDWTQIGRLAMRCERIAAVANYVFLKLYFLMC